MMAPDWVWLAFATTLNTAWGRLNFIAPRHHCERETCHNERGRSRLYICVDVANAVPVSATMQQCA